MKAFTDWLDKHLLLSLSLLLIVFIPLYPKLPLIDAIPGYLVRIRLEDVLVTITGVVWLVQVIRGRVLFQWKSTIFGLMALYTLVGFISVLIAIFLLNSIPFEFLHVSKSAFHFFRYIEYFSLFIFLFSAINSKRDLKKSLVAIGFTLLIVIIYGAGQKYLHFPLYSTMNREFSKGVRLYLTEFARVQSTFGGHYDLSAYLVISLPIILALSITVKNKIAKLGLLLLQLAGIWLLVMAGSKTSFIAYILGALVVGALTFKTHTKTLKKTLLGATLISSLLILLFGMMLVFGGDMSDKFVQVIENTPYINRVYLSASSKLPLPVSSVQKKTNQGTDERQKPSDVYIDVPNRVSIATISAQGEEIFVVVDRERTWSENALKYGLSMGIRLDTLWPQALKGFVINPYLGKGYATLNKNEAAQFTEADSTDNNFLRTLGETGLLGFITFYGVVWLVLKIALKNTKSKHSLTAAFNVGVVGATIGLILNAFYIDVFAASKVAFTYWAVAGIALKSYYLDQPQQAQQKDRKIFSKFINHLKSHWLFWIGLFLFLGLVHKNPFLEWGRVRNLDTNSNNIEQITTTLCLKKNFNWQLCRDQATAKTSLAPIYNLALMPFYYLHSDPGMYYYANLILSIISFYLFYLISRKVVRKKWLVSLSTAIYITNFYLYSYPSLPYEENLVLPLSLGAAYLILKMEKINKNKKVIASLLLLFLIFLTKQSIDQKILYVLAPFAILLLFWLLAKLLDLKSSKKRRLSTNHLFSVLAAVTFSYLIYSSFFGSLLKETVVNFRGGDKLWRYQTVRRANESLGNEVMTKNRTDLPYLISAISPDYFDLYSNDNYQLLPLSSSQVFNDKANITWGTKNYSDLNELYTQLLEENKKLFVTEYDLISAALTTDFEKIKSDFDLNLVEIDCDYKCNFYQLSLENGLKPPSRPTSINETQLEPEKLGSSYSFLLYSNRFEQGSLAVKSKYNTTVFLSQLSEVIKLDPDFMISLGDLIHKSENYYENLFNTLFADLVEFPIFYLPGNFDLINRKELPSSFQSFQTDSEFYLLITTDAKGKISLVEKKFILNQLLKLEKMEQIKNIFIISHRLIWVSDNDLYDQLSTITNQPEVVADDDFFSLRMLPKLKQLSDKDVYIMSGDLKASSQPTIFFRKDPNSNLTYLASGINNAPGDTYLQINVSPDDKVSFFPISINKQNLENIESYGLEYWGKTTLTPSPPPSQKESGSSLVRKIVVSFAGGLIVFVLLQKNRRK